MKTLYSQIADNSWRSALLLVSFPVILAVVTWVSLFCINITSYDDLGYVIFRSNLETGELLPGVLIVAVVWTLIASLFGSKMILGFAQGTPLKKEDNPEVYRLIENLCIVAGIKKVPAIYVVPDDSLNAFATGWSPNSASIALTTGIIKKLDKAELEGVIAHELAHIQNRDIRLMLIAITVVGIFSFVANVAFRSAIYSRGGKDENKAKMVMLIVAIVTFVLGVLGSTLVRFAISRKREYLADATGALYTRRPGELAKALEKIKADPRVEILDSKKSIAALCIDDPITPLAERKNKTWNWVSGLFATHPPIDERIRVLREMGGV